MSASRERKKRIAMREAEPASSHKKKKGAPWIGKVLTGVICAVAALGFVFLLLLGQGIPQRTLPALTIGEEKISIAEFEYHYQLAYTSMMSSGYGQYLGIDAATPLDKQTMGEEGAETWASYFQGSAESNLKDIVAREKAARAAGMTLTQEDSDLLADTLAGLAETSASLGMSSQAYLRQAFGRGMNEKTFTAIVERQLLADRWSESTRDSFVYTPEQIQAEYDENRNKYDTVTYRSYVIPVETPEDTQDEEEELSEEEAEAAAAEALEAAKADAAQKAEALLDNVTSAEDFQTAAQAYATEDELAADNFADSDYTLSRNASYSQSDLMDWLFDPARAPGDTAAIAEGDTGVTAVYFMERDEHLLHSCDVRHILVSPGEAGETEFTDVEWAQAKITADELYAEFLSVGTEQDFARLAKEHSEDTGSQANGGLYQNVYPGQMTESFNDWCFDPARAAGDTGLVQTEYGYHIMYYVKQNGPYWRTLAENTLRDADYDAKYAEISEAAAEPVREPFGFWLVSA